MTTTRSSTAIPRAASTAALQVDYLPSDAIACQPPSWWQNVLGVVGFEKPPVIERARVPVTASMTPSLGSRDDLCEVWRVAGPQRQLSNGAAHQSRVHYRFCEELFSAPLPSTSGPFRRGLRRAAARMEMRERWSGRPNSPITRFSLYSSKPSIGT